MTRYLLDTGIAGAWVNRRRPVRDRVRAALLAGHRVGICTPVLGELVAGAEGSNDPPRQLARLDRELAVLRLWPFDEPAAREYGRLWAELRRGGRPMQAIDIQVAAVAFALGSTTVVSMDSDLSAVPNLAVEDWSQPEPHP